MRIRSSVFTPHCEWVRILRICLLTLSLTIVAACSDDDESPLTAGVSEVNPPRVLGRVLSTADQLADAPGAPIEALAMAETASMPGTFIG